MEVLKALFSDVESEKIPKCVYYTKSLDGYKVLYVYTAFLPPTTPRTQKITIKRRKKDEKKKRKEKTCIKYSNIIHQVNKTGFERFPIRNPQNFLHVLTRDGKVEPVRRI